MSPRHFLDLAGQDTETLRRIVAFAHDMKAELKRGLNPFAEAARGRTLAMLFDKPSTRTRISFDIAMRRLGGDVLALNAADMQLGRGETVPDTARVMSRYVDAVMIRTKPHDDLLAFAGAATVPVVNGLTERAHPCQLIADVMTFEERLGPIHNRTVAWIGDGDNNVARSWIEAAVRFRFTLRIASPAPYAPAGEVVAWAHAQGAAIVLTEDPRSAAEGADCLVTDVWLSMGQDGEAERMTRLAPYRVDADLLALAESNAIFMHCLPAQRGREVTDEVLDGPRSAVLDEAENRMHAQRAILAWMLEII